MFSGIAVKLSHGVLISWDGRLLHHCTSHINSREGNVYGSFFSAKSRIIKHGMHQALRRSGEVGAPAGGTIAGLAEPVVEQHDDVATASSVDTSDEDDDGGDCDDKSIGCLWYGGCGWWKQHSVSEDRGSFPS